MSLAIYAFFCFFIYHIYGGLTSVLSIFCWYAECIHFSCEKIFPTKKNKIAHFKWINIFCGSLIKQLYLYFSGKLNENGFKYLRDMLATMVNIDDGDHQEESITADKYVKHNLYLSFKLNWMRVWSTSQKYWA